MIRIPTATYRIQVNSSFGFKAAKAIVPYLAELGISDIYVSPIFKPRKGSHHGYDVVDSNQLNSELGGTDDLDELTRELKDHEMGWLQDVIPNHMAYNYENQMLMDVLENGESSEYFYFFDVEWNHPYESIRGRLLAPFLGSFYGESLEKGEIQLRYDDRGLTINYYDLKFALKIESYITVFTYKLGKLKRKLGEDHPDFIKLLGILYVLKTLPSREDVNERYGQTRFIKRMLWELYSKNQEIKRFIDENIETFNGKIGIPESFNLLDSLLSEQLFRLSFWKVATEEINYRRFFNINELISLRIEDEDVFDHTHSLIFKLFEEGRISGLRIDHIDGLYDPTDYLKRLRKKLGEVYIVVEKVLDLEEELPSFWPVQGTTGYDFLNYANGIFCEKTNEMRFNKIYSRFGGFKGSYEDLVCEKKRLIIGKHMAGDIDNLAHLMKKISSRYRHGGDITLYGLKRALVEVMTLFPVYRTYIDPEVFSEADHSYVEEAVKRAKQSNPGLLNELNFIEGFLFLKSRDHLPEEEKRQWVQFVMRFQQFTGPLMAKGFEDTILYVYNRLLSLNEVGGSPDRFGISLEKFHRFNKRRVDLWPHSLNATSTHDTKRGEDVRARINVLSEIPEEWNSSIKQWSRINRRRRRSINGRNIPDRNDEYFLYQTLVGTFPFDEKEYTSFVGRLKNYIVKAVREAKIHTAWLKPDTDYEDAYISFVEEILEPSEGNPFLREFLPFQKKVSYYGIFNSLSQMLIKITSPGVPDFYQGTELWDLNLVDPDNRRPVDFEKRMSFLQDIRQKAERDMLSLISELASSKEDGRLKLFLIYRALKARNRNFEVFQNGTYIPLETTGRFRDHIIAFARKHEDHWAVTIAPRFLTALIKEGEYPLGRRVWDDTCILLPEGAPRSWKDAITNQIVKNNRTLPMGEVLGLFPTALLMREELT
jgi:(1->4)-alpha-D-glucan 1-alpha-D-glucosylmutase